MNIDRGEEEYTFHIKNGKGVSYNSKEKRHKHSHKDDRGKYKLKGIHRRSKKRVLENVTLLHKLQSATKSNNNGTTIQNYTKEYITFPIIMNGDGRHKILYTTRSIEKILSLYKLDEFPLRAQTDSSGKYYIYIEGYHEQEVKNYQIAIERMNSILEANSNLVKIIKETYSRDFSRI